MLLSFEIVLQTLNVSNDNAGVVIFFRIEHLAHESLPMSIVNLVITHLGPVFYEDLVSRFT